MARHHNPVTRFFSTKLFIFLAVFVQLLLPTVSMCPDGYLLPDCSQICPDGLYGLNCSSLCPGTCANYSCVASTGHCLRCRPGFTGSTCLEPCANGHFGQDCEGMCPEHCVKETCSPFTGFCLECLHGFEGKKCNLAPLFNDDIEGKKKLEHETEANQMFIISLMIVALLIIPACVVFVCVPRLKQKIRKRKMRLRQKKIFSTQSSGTTIETNLSYGNSFEHLRHEKPLRSVSEMSGYSLPFRLRQLRDKCVGFNGKERSNSERRQQRPIYLPIGSQRHKRRSFSLDSISSFDFNKVEKSSDRSAGESKLELHRLSRFVDVPKPQSGAICLSIAPQQVPKRLKRSTQREEISTTDFDDLIDPNAYHKLLVKEPSLFDHRRLYFKTVPPEKIVQPNIRYFQGGSGQEKVRTPNGKFSNSSGSISHVADNVISEGSSTYASDFERTGTQGGERFERRRIRHCANTSEIWIDSCEPRGNQAKIPSVKACLSSPDSTLDTNKTLAKIQSDFSKLEYTKSCTLAVAMDESTLPPYQATTRPVSPKCVRSPYAILTNVHSIMSIGRMMNAVMTYFQRSRYLEGENTPLTVTNNDLSQFIDSRSNALSIMHQARDNFQLQEVSQNTHFETEESKEDTTSTSRVTCSQRRTDEGYRHYEPIHKCFSLPTMTSAECHPTPGKRRQFNDRSQKREINEPREKELRMDPSSLSRYFDDCEQSKSSPTSRNPCDDLCYGEVYELCSEGAQIEFPICTKLRDGAFSTSHSWQTSRDTPSTCYGQSNKKRVHPAFQTQGNVRSAFKDMASDPIYTAQRKQETNHQMARHNAEEEGRGIALTDRLSDRKTCHRFSSSQKTDDTYLNEAEKATFPMTKGNVYLTCPEATTNVQSTKTDHPHSNRAKWSVALSTDLMDDFYESEDLLSVNCNQPILTRTGSDSYTVRRDEKAPRLKDRFPGLRDDTILPWEMPCNQRQMMNWVSEKAITYSTIPPVNVGQEMSMISTGISGHGENDSEVCGEISALLPSIGRPQPLIHYSEKPADVLATDIFLGKPVPIEPNEISSTDCYKLTKHEGKRCAEETVLRHSSRTSMKSGLFPQGDYTIDCIQTNAGNYGTRQHTSQIHPPKERKSGMIASSKTSQYEVEAKHTRKSSPCVGNVSTGQLLDRQVGDFPNRHHTTKAAVSSNRQETRENRFRSIPKNMPKGKAVFDADRSNKSQKSSRKPGTPKMNKYNQTTVNASVTNEKNQKDSLITDSKSHHKGHSTHFAPNQSQGNGYHHATLNGDKVSISASRTTSTGSSANEDLGSTGNLSCPISTTQDSNGSDTMKEMKDNNKDLTIKIPESEQMNSEQTDLANNIITGERHQIAIEYISASPKDFNESPKTKLKKETKTIGTSPFLLPLPDKSQGDTVDTECQPVSFLQHEGDLMEAAGYIIENNAPPTYRYPTPSLLENWVDRVPRQFRHKNEESSASYDNIMPRISCFLNHSQGYGEGGCTMVKKQQPQPAPLPPDRIDEFPLTEGRAEHHGCTIGCGTWDQVPTHQKDSDDSESEQYQDALSISSVEKRPGTFVASDETDRIMKCWESKCSASTITYTNSSDSVYETIKTVSQSEDYGAESVQDYGTNFVDEGGIEAAGCSHFVSADVSVVENEPQVRTNEEGSTCSFTSCEPRTYTIEGHGRSRGLQLVNKNPIMTQTSRKHLKEGSIQRATRGSMQAVEESSEDLKAVKDPSTCRAICFHRPSGDFGRLKTKRQRQGSKNDIELGLESSSDGALMFLKRTLNSSSRHQRADEETSSQKSCTGRREQFIPENSLVDCENLTTEKASGNPVHVWQTRQGRGHIHIPDSTRRASSCSRTGRKGNRDRDRGSIDSSFRVNEQGPRRLLTSSSAENQHMGSYGGRVAWKRQTLSKIRNSSDDDIEIDRSPESQVFHLARQSHKTGSEMKRTSPPLPTDKRSHRYQNRHLSNGQKNSRCDRPHDAPLDAQTVKQRSHLLRCPRVALSANPDWVGRRCCRREEYRKSLGLSNNPNEREDELPTVSPLPGNELFYDANDQ